MTPLQQNQSYVYSCVGHPSREIDGTHYCRATRSFLADGYKLCNSCPLYGGESTSLYHEEEQEHCPLCFYYDLDLGDAEDISGEEQQIRTESLITAGMIPKFPYFFSELDAVRRFGIMEEAIQFAAEKHDGQVRKGTDIPYICHPVEVMMIVAGMTEDAEVSAAAALHDTLEDTDTTYEELVSSFGKRIADLVAEESEDKRPGQSKAETWHIRKAETLEAIKDKPLEAKMILLADKLANMRSSYAAYQKVGDEFFNRFNVTDKSEHSWYHHGVLEALGDLREYPQYGEYRHLIQEIFE